MRLLLGLLLALVTCSIYVAGPAVAKPKVTTKYTYYTVKGKSARTLYQQMVRRGPHVSGERALASTTMRPRQSGEVVGRSTCRVRNYRLNLDFTIRLPKVGSEASLSPRLRKSWRAFSSFVKRHEQRHRAIWIGCGTRIETKIRKLRTKHCSKFDRLVDRIIETELTRCKKKHDAFDAAEQRRLARHPLVRAAKRTPRKTRTASAKRKKRAEKTRTRAFRRGRAADDF